ncbi:MAG: carboxypeptidase-like regulatory domain-containing protein [Acidobacteriota bacterium]
MHDRLSFEHLDARAALIVALTWGGLAAAPGPSVASSVELRLMLPEDVAPAEVEVHWESISRKSEDGSPDQLNASVEAPGSLRLDLEPGSVWQATITSESLWAARKIFTAEREPTVETLELWPMTRLRGRVEVEGGEAMPPALEARFESPPESPAELARTAVECPIVEGRFECAVPALRLDLRLRARSYLSHYLWDAQLQAAAPYDVGKILLRRGASVVGFVELEEADATFEAARVRLEKEVASANADAQDRQRRQASSLETTVNERGFFELTGVPEGLYALVVEHPEFARARYAPVQVSNNAESELYPIALHRAVKLRVEAWPERPGEDRRWGIELFRHGEAPGHFDLEAAGQMTEAGTWTSADLAPGDYVLRVMGGPESTWYREDLSLPAGAGTITRQLELPGQVLAGQVLLGEEPVAAELYFGGYNGTLRIPTRSDAEGSFEVQVPEHASWTVDVYVRDRSISQRFQEVTPDYQDEDGRHWLELVIHDTLVEGTVVDSQGRPVENARVKASGRGGGQTQRSEADGTFELRGLRPGEYWLRAEAADRSRRSEMLQMEVDPDEPAPPFELVLVEDRTIEGQVLSPSGQGIVGAKVVGWIEQSHERPIASAVPETVTDLTGSFSLAVPAATETMLLTALAPGFALRQLQIDSRSTEPVFIQVEPHGGQLRIRHADPIQRDMLMVFQTWKLPVHFTLTNWASQHGEPNTTPGEYVVPMLEPGYYQVCPDPTYMLQMASRLPPELTERCKGGFLPAYGELVAELD